MGGDERYIIRVDNCPSRFYITELNNALKRSQFSTVLQLSYDNRGKLSVPRILTEIKLSKQSKNIFVAPREVTVTNPEKFPRCSTMERAVIYRKLARQIRAVRITPLRVRPRVRAHTYTRARLNTHARECITKRVTRARMHLPSTYIPAHISARVYT